MKKILSIAVVSIIVLPMLAIIPQPVAGYWFGAHGMMARDSLEGLEWAEDDIEWIPWHANELDLVSPHPDDSNHRVGQFQTEFEKWGDEHCPHDGTEWYAEAYIEAARDYYADGNIAKGKQCLGYAIHYIQDALCPPHIFPFSVDVLDLAHADFEMYTWTDYGWFGNDWKSSVRAALPIQITSPEDLRDKVLTAAVIVNEILQPTRCSYVRQDGEIIGDLSGTIRGWKMSDEDIGMCMGMASRLVKGAAMYARFGATHISDIAIISGLSWLRAPGRQANDGSWYGDPAVTSFAVLSMLNWGYDESDEIVSKGMNYVLSKINPAGSVHNQPYRYTYYTSIAILPLAATGNADYHDEIARMRDWLVGSQWDESSFYGSVGSGHSYYGGFGYGSGSRPDLSNTQWALVGIKAADRVLGLEATDTYAKAADYFLERCQNADGGSGYTPADGSIHTMTAASVWSYKLCGRSSNDDDVLDGIQWLTDRYSLTNNDGWGYWSEYYYKVTLAKALTMTHKVMLGEHDWFAELAQKLADEQYSGGNWPDTGMMGSEMSTCWAIMALQTRTLPPSGEFGMWATLESHCDLHMYDSLGRHTGVDYITGTVEENIPGSDFKVLDPDGNEVPYSGDTPDEGYKQVIELSSLLPGSYRIELVGTSDGPYHLTVAGLSNGDQVATHTFEGTIEEGDRLATSVTVTSMEGALTLLYEPLINLPVLGVDPTHLDIVCVPDTILQAAFTVSEIGGEQTLHDVTMYCTDIVGVEGLINGDDVTFDINDFDIGPGGSQEVNASIPVPVDFKGPGPGSIIVESIDGGTREITLTLLPIVTATIDFDPDVLNLDSKGKYITAYIELPAGYNVSQIDISSIRLNGILPALGKPTEIGDYDNDSIPDLMVKFHRTMVQDILAVGEEVGVTITGEVNGTIFEGGDTIRVITAAAPHGRGEWTRVSTPTTEGWVLAPDSAIVDYAVADDGDVVCAIVYSDTTGEFHLLKSTDSAATWEDIIDSVEDALDDNDYINYSTRVATDNTAPDFLTVTLDMWDDSDGANEVHVFISDDGGATFEDAGEVEDGGVYFPDGYYVSDLEVSPEVDGKRDIAIGGRDNYGDAVLFRCTVTGDSAGDWENTTTYVGWDDNGTFTSMLVTDIIFSPSWDTDKAILVTTVADYGPYDVFMQSGTWGTSDGWNEWSILGIAAVSIIEDVDIPIWLGDLDARWIAGITVPEDYNSRNADTRYAWVWV
ncbi:MAG: hypothetical protein KAX31_07305, partial [Thermoplasmata archaeon]|nr:hypothetical protein [Thermoplasmata archaeon]